MKTQYGFHFILNFLLQLSDEEEEIASKRIVRSAKEKRYEEMYGLVKKIRTFRKNNDMSNILDCEFYTLMLEIALPLQYIKFSVDLRFRKLNEGPPESITGDSKGGKGCNTDFLPQDFSSTGTVCQPAMGKQKEPQQNQLQELGYDETKTQKIHKGL